MSEGHVDPRAAAKLPAATISRDEWRYYHMSIALCVMIPAGVLAGLLSSALNTKLNIGLVILPCVLGSSLVAERLLERQGRFRPGRSREYRCHANLDSNQAAPGPGVLELRAPVPSALGVISAGVVVTVATAVLLLFSRSSRFDGILLLVLTTALWWILLHEWWWTRQAPQVRVDAEGISGFPTGLYTRRTLLRWADVETCEIDIFPTQLGKPYLVRPTFRSRWGNVLLVLKLRSIPFEDQMRLVEILRAVLSKTYVDMLE
jgi:hypothetical protein